MAVFSTNQVRHLYVANKHDASVSASSELGTIGLKNDTTKSHLYFLYKGVDGLTRSDLIDTENIIYAKATKPESMAHKLKSYTISLDNTVSATPVAGQDYLLRLTFSQYVGMSEEDKYFKYGSVHAYTGMTADTFYKILAQSIAMNMSRETTQLLKIEVHSKATKSKGKFDASGYMEVNASTKDTGKSDSTNPYYGDTSIVTDIDSIRLTEVEQPWRLGVIPQVFVNYVVTDDTITVNGDERHWATIVEGTNGTLNNGKNIADLEYFCMGERGDQYRQIGWPYNISTTYLVDPSKPYYTFDIHYAYVGSNESVQKSEKTITIVSPDKTELNKVITAFNSASGLSITSLT